MSLKPLNFYQQWAVAGMQQDQYSQAPWFVDSKNLDIFSSSQSVRATAWSVPKKSVENESIIEVDDQDRYELHGDWTIKDKKKNKTINIAKNLNKFFWNIDYGDGLKKDVSLGLPQSLIIEYNQEGDNEAISVIGESAIVSYSTNRVLIEKITIEWPNILQQQAWTVYNSKDKEVKWIQFKVKKGVDVSVNITLPETFLDIVNICVRKVNNPEFNSSEAGNLDFNGNVELKSASLRQPNIVYKPQTKIWQKAGSQQRGIFQNGNTHDEITNSVSDFSNGNEFILVVPGGGQSTTASFVVRADQDFDGILTICAETERAVQFFPPEFLGEKKLIQQGLYHYIVQWNLIRKYSFYSKRDKGVGQTTPWIMDMERELLNNSRVAWLVFIHDYVFAFCNKFFGTGYISTHNDLGEQVNFTMYEGFEFVNAVKVGEIIYVVARDRWIIGLYAFYNGILKKLIAWGILSSENSNIINPDEHHLSWLMCARRGGLILWTTDNKILLYGEKWGQNTLSSIFENPNIGSISKVNARKDQLQISYFWKDGEKYLVELQSDRILRNYQSDFSITFPKQIGSHLLEKEPKELEISYMLPNKNCSLEVWLNVNDYHFRTYELEGEVQLTNGSYKIDGTDGEYQLKFIEKWENKLTFVLEGELPHQTEKKPLKLIKVDGDWPEEIPAKSFDHFKHIWSIREEQFTHGKQRLIALTAEHNLPRARVLQVRVDWKTDWKSSPEIYSVHFTSEQVER